MSEADEPKPPFHWRQLGEKQVRFSGTARSVDDTGRHLFAVRTSTGAQLFGEFIELQEVDHAPYRIEIRSFGYSTKGNVGNPSPGARADFTAADADAIRDSVTRLFHESGESHFRSTGRETFSAVKFASCPAGYAYQSPNRRFIGANSARNRSACVGRCGRGTIPGEKPLPFGWARGSCLANGLKVGGIANPMASRSCLLAISTNPTWAILRLVPEPNSAPQKRGKSSTPSCDCSARIARSPFRYMGRDFTGHSAPSPARSASCRAGYA